METKHLSVAQCAARLKQLDDILVIFHRRPDGDTIGSCAALALALEKMGKNVRIYPGHDITAKLTPFVEKFYPGEGFEPACRVTVDIASRQLFPEKSGLEDAEIALAIDHHPSNPNFANELCNDPGCAACGELVLDIIRAMDVEIDHDIALALYLAISTDTGCFRYSNTTAHSHRAAADMMEYGIDYAALNRSFFTEKSQARMRLEAAFMSTMTMHFDGRVAVAHLTPDMIAACGANGDDEEDIVGVIRAIEGVEAAVMVKQLADGGCKISLRTNKNLNATNICARFGGGGHAAAAGCSIDAGVEEAKELMLRAIEDEENA
ncbi:MAG: bifunctional oligoribonuclease/PAP phosphatase NrnA [Oscillospiraceae bacterium]|nr:bifunctional oligoribonuclease/PAP phosphatase NrnA [Oscillospiraceae bacterium]